MRTRVLVLVAAIAALMVAGRSTSGAGKNGTCSEADVHREAGPMGNLPWVIAGEDIEGVLFYYAADSFAETQKAVMPVGGRAAEGRTTKILWVISRNAGTSLSVTGTDLNSGSSFSDEFLQASSPAGHFPSVIELPKPGCWQLALTTGGTKGSVTFEST